MVSCARVNWVEGSCEVSCRVSCAVSCKVTCGVSYDCCSYLLYLLYLCSIIADVSNGVRELLSELWAETNITKVYSSQVVGIWNLMKWLLNMVVGPTWSTVIPTLHLYSMFDKYHVLDQCLNFMSILSIFYHITKQVNFVDFISKMSFV